MGRCHERGSLDAFGCLARLAQHGPWIGQPGCQRVVVAPAFAWPSDRGLHLRRRHRPRRWRDQAFDPAAGAQIDTTLTETTAAGLNPGKLGAITSLKGSIASNDQLAGTSTLTITGDIAAGHMDGPVNPASVVCAADGKSVSIIGRASAGSTPVLLVISLAKDHFSVAAATPAGAGGFFLIDAPGVAALVPGGAQVSGDAPKADSSDSAPVIHLAGDVTCG